MTEEQWISLLDNLLFPFSQAHFFPCKLQRNYFWSRSSYDVKRCCNASISDSLRFCGGLILDIKRKLPFFASDFYDALHIQSLSTILFIYLGTVTNAITFGGLLGDATENMQVTKSLVLDCISHNTARHRPSLDPGWLFDAHSLNLLHSFCVTDFQAKITWMVIFHSHKCTVKSALLLIQKLHKLSQN